MAKKIRDIVFSTKLESGAYKNVNIGAVIKCDNGSELIKLDFIPTDLNKGALMLFSIKEKVPAN